MLLSNKLEKQLMKLIMWRIPWFPPEIQPRKSWNKKKKLKTDKYQPKINFQHINLMDLFKLNCILFWEWNERVSRWLNDV